MPTFDELRTVNDTLIRKGLQGAVFVAPLSVDDEIDALKDGTGLLALPTGYDDVGRITKDQGVSWTRDVETSDVTSLGAAEPTRRDVLSDVSGMNFIMQESKAITMGLYDGLDLSGVTQDANGNVYYDKPDRPANTYYRVLALFKDGEGADAMYFAKWLPRAQITDRAEQSWNESTEVQYNITLTAFRDPDFGTSVRTLWAGPAAQLTAMGFAAA